MEQSDDRTRTGFAATVLITTKDRKDVLRRAVQTACAQTLPVEILVFDDGSTDGTSEMVRNEFPQVRLVRVAESLGIIAARNEGITLASTPIVITIDDDCLFPSPNSVMQTLAELEHPRVGVVAIPSIDVQRSSEVIDRAPQDQGVFVTAHFRGGANALRRDLFLVLGRYRAAFYRQGEESDFVARLLEAGYVVRLGRADPIHHDELPVRNIPLIRYYSCRNGILFAWNNVPALYLPLVLLGSMWHQLQVGVRRKCLGSTLRGLGAGYAALWKTRLTRQPMSTRSYQMLRMLRRTRACRLEDVQDQLAPLLNNS